jgi:DNA-binding CsgD family transcriptional regulator
MSQLSMAVTNFAERATRMHTPAAVVDDYHKLAQQFDLSVVGVWVLPRVFRTQEKTWHPNTNVFLHPSMPHDFWSRYQQGFREHGHSYLTMKARNASVPFTFAEARDEARRLDQHHNWVFGLLDHYKWADGIYFTSRRWLSVMYSSRLLALSPSERAWLAAASTVAIGRVEQVAKAATRRAFKVAFIPLTARETEVLQHLVNEGDNATAAKTLNISVDTIAFHLRHIRRKFKVKSTMQAALAAYQQSSIYF